MLINDIVELFIVSREIARDLKLTLKGLQWTTFESWLSVNKPTLLEALSHGHSVQLLCQSNLGSYYRGLCPYFDLDVAETSTRDCHIPELTQAVFYAMVLNDAVALGVSCVFVTDILRWVLECLNWGVLESWLKTNGEALHRAHSQRLAHPGPILIRWAAKKKTRGRATLFALLVMRSRLRILDLCKS
ncbi:hypothetical protein Cgig2_029440 [Carnegiea gigantea]|uniref:Uncharacterized protein n=1 Tax=Carnegiea gigantea TaxID=171969 RepID=A0A9Q1Q9M1_9CARY|nr:hypothetical protein Cgig2_029440 [Carnegiea gigantea]